MTESDSAAALGEARIEAAYGSGDGDDDSSATVQGLCKARYSSRYTVHGMDLSARDGSETMQFTDIMYTA